MTNQATVRSTGTSISTNSSTSTLENASIVRTLFDFSSFRVLLLILFNAASISTRRCVHPSIRRSVGPSGMLSLRRVRGAYYAKYSALFDHFPITFWLNSLCSQLGNPLSILDIVCKIFVRHFQKQWKTTSFGQGLHERNGMCHKKWDIFVHNPG